MGSLDLTDHWDMPEPQVRFLLCVGDILISLCDEGRLKSWRLKRQRDALDGGASGKEARRGGHEGSDRLISDAALEGGFVPTALAHPPTYLNKVVIGSEAGALQLWNVRSGK